MLKGKQSRTDDYRPDSLVSTISAQLEDYRNSGYDRGHLCNAGDMKLNHTSITESFLLSNISPQDRDFNAGIWNTLEEQVEYSDKDIVKENQADEFAIKWTLTKEEEAEILDATPLNEQKIRVFAKKFNTHPAIIMGRLQHDKLIPYYFGREFFEPIIFE